MFSNTKLLLAILASSAIMFVVLLVPALRDIFGIAILPTEKIIQVAILAFSPIVIVEIFKSFKINASKDE